MIRFRRPSPALVESFLSAQSSEPFSYAPIGVTALRSPKGFAVNHKRTKVGSGEAAFIAARDAIRGWHQFKLTWMELWPVDASVEIGQGVAIIAHAAGVFWLNACRVVYVIDESGPPRRFGFAYGTLSDHAACGEERFLIEWDSGERRVVRYSGVLASATPVSTNGISLFSHGTKEIRMRFDRGAS
jgi:uncharacterized protein (UPF0548 family)